MVLSMGGRVENSRRLRNKPTALGRLAQAVWGLVRAWWKVDRIRVRPAEGRLLRLQPGCVISVEQRPVEIIRRHTKQSDASGTVLYDCSTADGTANLVVVSDGNGHVCQLAWVEGGGTRLLLETDIS